MTDNGVGFGTAPTITVAAPAAGVAVIRQLVLLLLVMLVEDLIVLIQYLYKMLVLDILLPQPTVTISNPETISGVGTYQFNEVVQGMRSGTQARVKNWDADTNVYYLFQTLELDYNNRIL